MAKEDEVENEITDPTFLGDIRDVQGQYSMLVDVYERQRSYGKKVSEMIATLQQEIDGVVKIPAEEIGAQYTAAYLVSDAVVVTFDLTRNMTSRPLRSLPVAAMVSVVEACTPELKRLLSEKQRCESSKVASLERVLNELEATRDVVNLAKRGAINSRSIAAPSIHSRAPIEAARSVPEPTDAITMRGNIPSEDALILDAVSASLDMLGEDGKRVILSLLEKRYDLNLEDIPSHPRGFIEVLDELLGTTARQVEQEIVSRIEKSRPVKGTTFCEVVASLKGDRTRKRKRSSGITRAGPKWVSVGEPHMANKAVVQVVAPATSGPATGQNAADDVAEAQPGKEVNKAGAFNFNFEVVAKPIPISRFLQS